jgi:fumarate reductase subunit D
MAVSLVVLVVRLVTAFHRLERTCFASRLYSPAGVTELQEFEPKLWSFVIAVVAVLGVGVPVALGAVSAHRV